MRYQSVTSMNFYCYLICNQNRIRNSLEIQNWHTVENSNAVWVSEWCKPFILYLRTPPTIIVLNKHRHTDNSVFTCKQISLKLQAWRIVGRTSNICYEYSYDQDDCIVSANLKTDLDDWKHFHTSNYETAHTASSTTQFLTLPPHLYSHRKAFDNAANKIWFTTLNIISNDIDLTLCRYYGIGLITTIYWRY